MAWESTFRPSPVYSTGATGSKSRKIVEILRNFSKNSENVQKLPNASGCIPTHPSRSVWVRMDPNALRNLEKLQKTCENVEQFTKNREKSCENFWKFASVLSLFGPLRQRPERKWPCKSHFGTSFSSFSTTQSRASADPICCEVNLSSTSITEILERGISWLWLFTLRSTKLMN